MEDWKKNRQFFKDPQIRSSDPSDPQIRPKSAPKTSKSGSQILLNPKNGLQDLRKWPPISPNQAKIGPKSGPQTLPNPKNGLRNPPNQAKIGPKDPQIRASDPSEPQKWPPRPPNQAKIGAKTPKNGLNKVWKQSFCWTPSFPDIYSG